jgi:transposase
MERKVKYDYAFKEKCVKLVLEKHHSYGYVSKLKGVDKSNIRKWVGFYKQYGKSGLIPRINQSYTIDFKLKVLQSIDEDFLSLREASLKFNIPDAAIIVKWRRDFANFGLKGLEPKGKPKSMSNFKRKKHKSDKPLTREEELLLEIESLRCENDLLKKLHALIQAEEQAKKRKP